MAEKRKFELHLLRYLPFELKEDSLTIGLMLVEDEGRFSEVRFTRDWRMLQCVARDVEVEWFEGVERELRAILKNVWRREDLNRFIEERIGLPLVMSPPKAVLTDDPIHELQILESIYFATTRRAPVSKPSGVTWIRREMREHFSQTGVLGLMQQNMDLSSYTGAGDPFRIDFGYRLGGELKMFHAVSLSASGDPALALAYRYSLIRTNTMKAQLQPSLTAVVESELRREETTIGFAIGMLEANRVRVRAVTEMAEVALEVKRELRG